MGLVAKPRPEKLRAGLTKQERAEVQESLDPDARLAAWEATWGPLSNVQKERLNELWNSFHELPGPVWLNARRVNDPESKSVFARFVAYYLLSPEAQAPAPGWYVSGYLARTPTSGTTVRQLAIEPENEDQPGVTVEVLRGVKPGEIIGKVRALFDVTAQAAALEQGWGTRHLSLDQRNEIATLADEARRITLKRGAKGFPDSYYRGLAAAYVEERGRGRGVLNRLADRYDRPRETIRDHLNRARTRGFLQGGGRSGKLSYEPGPRF